MPSNTGYYTPPKTAYDNQRKTPKITYYDEPRDAPLSNYKRPAENLGPAPSDPETGAPGALMDPTTFPWADVLRPSTGWPKQPSPTMPASTGPSGGGGYGGGGGTAGLTLAQQQAMLRMIGQGPSLYDFMAYQDPGYQAYTPAARDASIYEEARKRLAQALASDRSLAQGYYDDLFALLDTQENPLANPRMTETPGIDNAYQRLLSNMGGEMVGDVIDAENAYSQNSDDAFANLMAILAAQEDRNMQSRRRQGQQDLTSALTGIDAMGTGMLGGVEMADLQDARDYQRYLDEVAMQEYRYAADREAQAAMANWQARQGVNQGNTGIQNDWRTAIMELIPLLTDSGVVGQIGA